jgi:hypothetical protein
VRAQAKREAQLRRARGPQQGAAVLSAVDRALQALASAPDVGAAPARSAVQLVVPLVGALRALYIENESIKVDIAGLLSERHQLAAATLEGAAASSGAGAQRESASPTADELVSGALGRVPGGASRAGTLVAAIGSLCAQYAALDIGASDATNASATPAGARTADGGVDARVLLRVIGDLSHRAGIVEPASASASAAPAVLLGRLLTQHGRAVRALLDDVHAALRSVRARTQSLRGGVPHETQLALQQISVAMGELSIELKAMHDGAAAMEHVAVESVRRREASGAGDACGSVCAVCGCVTRCVCVCVSCDVDVCVCM